MNPHNGPLEAPSTVRSTNQFSLRALLIATAVVSVLCCIFFTLPSWVGGLFLLIAMLLFMPATLAALVYGRGRTRAFAVGAMPPMSIVFLTFTGLGGRLMPFYDFGPSDFELKIMFAIVTVVIAASGFIGQAVRWWCLRNVNRDHAEQAEPNRGEDWK